MSNIDKNAATRNFGVELVGDIDWGTHLCQFYGTKQDLIDILVPYFAEGLKSNEFCMWVTSPPLEVKEAKKALRKEVPDLARYIKNGQLEIVSYTDWYVRDGVFDADRVLQGWVEKEKNAIARGFEGLRLSGNTFWIERKDWESFADYEATVNEVIGSHRMIALCTYSLKKCKGTDVIDVMRNHRGTLIRKGEAWNLVEDVAVRKKAENGLKREKEFSELFLGGSVDGIIALDRDFRLTTWNPAMERISGVSMDQVLGRPVFEVFPFLKETGEARFLQEAFAGKTCAAMDLRYRMPGNDQEQVFEGHYSPIRTPKGEIAGVFGIVRDVTEKKKIEGQRAIEREMLRGIMENSGAMLAYLDRDFNFVTVNSAYAKGSGHKIEELVGRNHFSLFPNEENQVLFTRVRDTGVPIAYFDKPFEFSGQPGRGVTYWDWTLTPVKDQAGLARGLVLSLIETTERVKAGEEVRNLARFPGENPNPVIRIAANGTISYCNPSGMVVLRDWKSEVGQLAPEHICRQVTEALQNGTKIEFEEQFGQTTLHFLLTPLTEYVNLYAMDVTERRKAEEKLFESEKKYRTLYETMADGTVKVDMEGRIIECNEAYANMLGYSKEELQGFNFRQVATERWRQIEDQILTNKVLTRGFSDLYEVEYARKDGTVFPVNIRVWLSRSEGGEPEGMWALVRDINVRKKIESELRETRNYLSNLLNYANAPIIVWDPEFKITMFNRAFERLTGLSADDVVGKQLDMLFPRESKEEALNHIKRALEGEYWNAVEIPVLHSDRTVRVVLWNSANIQDPSGKRVIATIAQGQDITERKKTEEALEHSERRHRTLVETAPEVIYTVTEDGNIASLNSAFEKITGYSRDEWIGKPFGSLIHPDDLPLALEKFQQSLRGENPSLFNLRVRAKSGEYLIGEFTSVPQMEKGIVWGLARDISERKKTEEALIDSERRASRAQEIAHLGSWELDLAGNRLSWSDEVYRIFGLQPQRFSATYEAFLEAVHPDDRATVDAAYYGSVRDGREGYEIEHRIVRKSDGQVRVVHERCEHVRDGSGRIVRSVGMVHDITERKKAEQALEESEERFRVIAETSPIQISVSRALDGTILFTNPAYDDAFGFAKGELIGQKAPNLYFDPADRAALIGTVKKQGFVRNYEVRVKRKDGTPFWVIASISTVGFGGEQAILGASVDITENKKMQQAIERAGREWERTFDSVPDLIAILDKQHRIVRANLAMAQKLRLTPQKCSGLTCFECVHGTQGPPDVCPHAQTMKDGLEHAAELHEDRLGGDFLVTTTPLKDEQGQMVGSVHVARNITESKRLQEKLEQYTKHLEQLVEERTQKLKDAQRLATIGEVAAMVGHDIRNPLQSIEGALFLAKKELESLPPETQQTATLKEMVSTIQEESGYVDKIVSDLQDYARPLAPKAEQFDLEQLVAKTLMSVAIPESIETSTAIEDGCRIMTADFTMMKRIVTNLTTNAIQAMPHGGRLTIGATRIDGEIRITFQDTGEGISDDMKPRIFQPLFSTKAKGQGFGLAVVKRLVEGLKGQITFDSEVGKGTTFTVTIPIKQETKQ